MDILSALLPIATTAGGYMLKRKAINDADKKRSAVLREMQALNTDAQRRMVDITNQQVETYRPERRMPALQQAEQAAVQRYTSDVSAPEMQLSGPVYGGKVSGDYTAGKAQRAADELRYATKLASLMGRVAAPADLALEQSFSNTDAALARGGVRSDLRGNMGVRELQLGTVEPSGGMMMAGDLLMGAGVAANAPPPVNYAPQGAAASAFGAPAPQRAPAPQSKPQRYAPGTNAYWTGGRRP